MADRLMMITWGDTIPGREERGLEVFNEALGLYGRMQQDGRIESMDVALMNPNQTLDGYIQIKGSAQQLAAVREDDDFRRTLFDASLVVEDLAVCDGVCDQGIAEGIAMYQEAISKVPQHT